MYIYICKCIHPWIRHTFTNRKKALKKAISEKKKKLIYTVISFTPLARIYNCSVCCTDVCILSDAGTIRFGRNSLINHYLNPLEPHRLRVYTAVYEATCNSTKTPGRLYSVYV